MAKLQELLKSLAAKAGQDQEGVELKAFLESIKEVGVPDSIATGIESGLFNLDAAKANSTIASHFKAQALSGVDAEIEKNLLEAGFTPDQITDITGEKNSYAKIKLSVKKIQELSKGKEPKEGSDESKALKKEVEKLHQTLKETTEKHQSELAAAQQAFQNERLSYAMQQMISTLPLAGDQPEELKRSFAAQFMQTALQQNKAKLELKDGNLVLLNADTGADFYDAQNNKLDAKAFINKQLADNKFLRVSDPNTKPAQTPQMVVENGKKVDSHTAFQLEYYSKLNNNSQIE